MKNNLPNAQCQLLAKADEFQVIFCPFTNDRAEFTAYDRHYSGLKKSWYTFAAVRVCH